MSSRSKPMHFFEVWLLRDAEWFCSSTACLVHSHVCMIVIDTDALCHPVQPPLSPNSLAHCSYCLKPALLTLGLMVSKLAWKSSNWIGRISSMLIWRSFSPRLRSGPIAASLARAVISEPEKPIRRVRDKSKRSSMEEGTTNRPSE